MIERRTHIPHAVHPDWDQDAWEREDADIVGAWVEETGKSFTTEPQETLTGCEERLLEVQGGHQEPRSSANPSTSARTRRRRPKPRRGWRSRKSRDGGG